MEKTPSFITGKPRRQNTLLRRFMPQIHSEVGPAWLEKNLKPGESGELPWVLDPFGASPAIVLEAARAGYRVLAAVNNPVTRFLFEIGSHPLEQSDLRSALADMAAAYKGDERLEPHLRQLYHTECAACGRVVEAEAFIWERGALTPSARLYTCTHCGDGGEREATEQDVRRARQWGSGGPYRARALERIAPLDDPDRQHAEEALQIYPPRAVYALFTLIHKLDSLPVERRISARILLLSALEASCSLWSPTGGRSRPLQLSIPPRYRENNVWFALENTVDSWNLSPEAPVPLTSWPDLPPSTGGVCLFEGRSRDLNLKNGPIHVGALLAALPRPNQAFWTLSALWAAWLWGRDAAAPFKSVLRRRRYDWGWHTTALANALNSLVPQLEACTPFLGLIAENDPGLLSSAIIAAHISGFDLLGVALRLGSEQTQIHWERRPAIEVPADETAFQEDAAIDLLRKSGQDYLRQRAEPVEYLPLHASGLMGLSKSPGAAGWNTYPPSEALTHTHNSLQQALTYRGQFLRFGGSEHSLEVGRWWLRSEAALTGGLGGVNQPLPLADRIEMFLVSYLLKNRGSTFQEIDQKLCIEFSGLFTPELEMVQACLESYAETTGNTEGIPDASSGWYLKEQDEPRNRRADVAAMINTLMELGSRLGYHVKFQPESEAQVSAQDPVEWIDSEGQLRYKFHILASAVFGKVALIRPPVPCQAVIIYPGSRASLAAYKMRSDPRLRKVLEEDWHLVKFRHLRRLAEDSSLHVDNFTAQLDLDPVTNDDPQMSLW